MNARFRVEIQDAPWVYETAATPIDAQRVAVRLLETYSDGVALVHDLRKQTTRMFTREGSYLVERTRAFKGES